jgi:hypothetical protein
VRSFFGEDLFPPARFHFFAPSLFVFGAQLRFDLGADACFESGAFSPFGFLSTVLRLLRAQPGLDLFLRRASSCACIRATSSA